MNVSPDSLNESSASQVPLHSAPDPVRNASFFSTPARFVSSRDFPVAEVNLTVDAAPFRLSRYLLERGYRPPGDLVDPAAFINHFVQPVWKGDSPVSLDVTGAASPFHSDPEHRLILVRISSRGKTVSSSEPDRCTLILNLDEAEQRNISEAVAGAVPEFIATMGPGTSFELIASRQIIEFKALDPGDPRTGTAPFPRVGTLDEEISPIPESGKGPHRIFIVTQKVNRKLPASGSENPDPTTQIDLSRITRDIPRIEEGPDAQLFITQEAARRVLRKISEMEEPVARDARVEIHFEPSAVESYRSLSSVRGKETAARSSILPGTTLPGNFTSAAMYELRIRPDRSDHKPLATVTLTYRPSDHPRTKIEIRREIYFDDLSTSWEKAPLEFQLPSLAAEYSMILRETSKDPKDQIENLYQKIMALSRDQSRDPRWKELLSLVDSTRTAYRTAVVVGNESIIYPPKGE